MPNPSRRRKSPPVELFTNRKELRAFFVRPWPRELDPLRTLRRSLSGNEGSATTIRTERQLLSFDSEKDGALQVCAIPRALIAAAVVLLANARVPATVCRSLIRLPPLPQPVQVPTNRAPTWLPGVIKCIQGNWQFMLNRGPGAPSPCQIVEWVVRSFPKSSIAIVSENQAECSAIDSSLRKQSFASCHLRGGLLPDVLQRVVGTCASGHASQDIEQRDFVIFTDARHGFSERGRLLIEHAPNARLIGICRQDDWFSPWERDWLFALFGGARLTLTKHSQIGANSSPSIADIGRALRQFLATRPGRSYAT
jgi:hypothetical protein